MYAATFYLPHVLLTFAVHPLAGFTHLPHPASISGIALSGNTTSAPVTTSPTSMATSCRMSSHLPFSLAPYTPDWLTGGASADLSLSISMHPVPARVVQQIRAGRFIEMRDLLWDNAALRHHYEEMHGAMGFHVFPVASRPRVREVTTLPSWICCFLTFLAASTADQTMRERITYITLSWWFRRLCVMKVWDGWTLTAFSVSRLLLLLISSGT